LDRAWQDTKVKMGMSTDALIGDDLDTSPVEKARLRVIWVPMLLTICSVIAFSWTLHNHMVSVIPYFPTYRSRDCHIALFGVAPERVVYFYGAGVDVQANTNCYISTLLFPWLFNLLQGFVCNWILA
jgi:hypothetical protein